MRITGLLIFVVIPTGTTGFFVLYVDMLCNNIVFSFAIDSEYLRTICIFWVGSYEVSKVKQCILNLVQIF